jgi:hypothetical protein
MTMTAAERARAISLKYRYELRSGARAYGGDADAIEAQLETDIEAAITDACAALEGERDALAKRLTAAEVVMTSAQQIESDLRDYGMSMAETWDGLLGKIAVYRDEIRR